MITARKGSVLFFGTIYAMLLYVVYCVITDTTPYMEYLQFWWVVLTPIAIAKSIGKNKLSDWSESTITFKL